MLLTNAVLQNSQCQKIVLIKSIELRKPDATEIFYGKISHKYTWLHPFAQTRQLCSPEVDFGHPVLKTSDLYISQCKNFALVCIKTKKLHRYLETDDLMAHMVAVSFVVKNIVTWKSCTKHGLGLVSK